MLSPKVTVKYGPEVEIVFTALAVFVVSSVVVVDDSVPAGIHNS